MSSENETGNFSPPKRGQKSPKDLNRSGNLTGSERKIKDGVADVYNLIQKWRSGHSTGMKIVDEIANIKLQHIYKDTETEMSAEGIPEELESPCNRLHDIVQKMDKVVKKLEMLTVMFTGVMKLEQHQNDDVPVVLFQTWTPDLLVSTVKELTTMYKAEYRLKRLIYENICHVKDRNSMMFYTSSWLHQPYLTDKGQMLLDSLLLETGHK